MSQMVGVSCRWQDARLMPGASRLLRHLHSHGIPMALATSTPRATYEAKMCGKAAQSLCSVFQASARHLTSTALCSVNETAFRGHVQGSAQQARVMTVTSEGCPAGAALHTGTQGHRVRDAVQRGVAKSAHIVWQSNQREHNVREACGLHIWPN